MNNKNKKIIFILGLGLLILGLGFQLSNQSREIASDSNFSTSTPTNDPSGETQEIIITPADLLPPYQGVPVADLDADLKIVNQISSAEFERQKKILIELSENLKSNPADIESWFTAAIIKKFFNDLVGARDIWEYVAKISPNNSVAHNNLGNLEKLENKNYSVAESHYLKAISNDPKFSPAITNLAELYWSFLLDRQPDALKILKQGIAANPEAADLMATLGGYYRSLGDKEQSLKYFKDALNLNPKNEGLRKVIQDIEATL